MQNSQDGQQDNGQSNRKLSEEEIEVAIILHNLSEIKKLIGIMNTSFNTIVEHIEKHERDGFEGEIFAYRACKETIECVIKGAAITLSKLNKYEF
jgi:hypothetical protein